MRPDKDLITIHDNLRNIEDFISDMIIRPRMLLRKWAHITNQTPAVKIGYIGQHIASLITGVAGTGSGARGDDLADGTEAKSCNKVDQADKCRNCGCRVMRQDSVCPRCGGINIDRKEDSKWLFSVRDDYELEQYHRLRRVLLLLMDYPKFAEGDFSDIRISAFEIYPQEKRMRVFNELVDNHYLNIYRPKADKGLKTNPMNLHPWSLQFYKCNPILVFQCVIRDIDRSPVIETGTFVSPETERGDAMKSVMMPSSLLRRDEWKALLSSADYDNDIRPLLREDVTEERFAGLSNAMKSELLPFIDERLREFVPLRKIVTFTQKTHYRR